MTKFILHGGFTPHKKQENDNFFKEVLSSAPKQAKILLVYFAKEADRISKNRDEDIEEFNKNKEEKVLSFEVANMESFREQVKNAHVIYLHGGTTAKILEALKHFPDMNHMFEGKIVAGDSAGANVLCSVFYSMSMGASEGFGVIPLKIICHYLEENRDKLNDIKPNLETVFLKEYEYKVFNF